MAYREMYPGINNSPVIEIAVSVSATDTRITVTDATQLPAAPNLLTIGNDENAELVLYNGVEDNTLTGCIRGFNGTLAQVWMAGNVAYRAFTEYDYAALVENFKTLKADTKTWIDEIIRAIVVDRVVYAELYSGAQALATSAGEDIIIDKRII